MIEAATEVTRALRLTPRETDALGRLAQVVLVVVVAVLARTLLHRAIDRLVRTTTDGALPTALRPLKERGALNGLLESAGLLSERRRQRAETIGSILRSVSSVTVLLIAGLTVLNLLVPKSIAPTLASAGVVGVALGFGAQNLVKDFLSGIFMILEDQYGVGDAVDLGQASGTVEAVGLRTTRVRDVDGTVWYVRNGEIVRVGNSSQGFAQVVLDVPVPWSVPTATAERAVRGVAAELWRQDGWRAAIVDEPQLLGVEQLTADGLVLRLVVRTRPEDKPRVARELRRRLKERLQADGISLSASPAASGPPAADPPAGSAGDGAGQDAD